MKKLLPLLLALLLLTAAGCGAPADDQASLTVTVSDGDILGEGALSFPLVIADGDGNEICVTVNTDRETVGEALLEVKLVAGEENDYGLYVKTVNGITADYDTDGVYWAFYINGEYAMTSVDSTLITAETTYALRIE